VAESLTEKKRGIALQAAAIEGAIVIVVSSDVVKFATEHHGEFWDPDATEGDGYRLKVSDEQVWIESVARRLNYELGESGDTLLTQALDKAIYDAADQGEEGVDIDV
jgi:hypothetical protein